MQAQCNLGYTYMPLVNGNEPHKLSASLSKIESFFGVFGLELQIFYFFHFRMNLNLLEN